MYAFEIAEESLLLDSLQPVKEVLMTSELDDYRVLKNKLLLPYDKSHPNEGHIIFLNTKTNKDSIDLMIHPRLLNINKYRRYYIEWKYNLKVLNKRYMNNDKRIREPDYKAVEETVPNMYPMITIDACRGKNLFYDMYRYNSFYLERQPLYQTYMLKVNTYINLMKDVIDSPQFKEYPNRTMLIDVKSWLPDKTNNPGLNLKQFDNVVFMFYYLMLKDHEKFKEIGDIDIVFIGPKGIFKINPSRYKEKDHYIYRRLVNLISPVEVFPKETDPKLITIDMIKQAVAADAKKYMDKFGLTGSPSNEPEVRKTEDEIEKAIDDKIVQTIDKMVEEEEEKEPGDIKPSRTTSEDDTEIPLDGNDETVDKIIKLQKQLNQPKNIASMKRDEELRKKQAELKIKNTPIEELLDTVKRQKRINLESNNVSDKVATINKNVTDVKYPSFEKVYNRELYNHDITSVFKSLNDKKIGIFIRDIKVEDTSDEMNLKETWTVSLEDELRNRHTIKVDMPKFLNDSFLYMGGNKKLINKQFMLMPVVKHSPDEVQLVSNYRKIFVHRYGTKTTTNVEALLKHLDGVKSGKNITIKRGNASKNNKKYKSFFEYDELSKHFTSISVKNPQKGTDLVEIILDQDEVQSKIGNINSKYKVKDDEICIGFWHNNIGGKIEILPITINSETGLLADNTDLSSFIASNIGGEIFEKYSTTKHGKKYMFARAVIMKKNVPIILLLSYCEGLSTILRKAEINHQFTDTRPKTNIYPNQRVVKFADGYLVYDNSLFFNSLLMSGLSEMYTENYEYSEFDEKDIYLDIIEARFGRRLLASAFEQFYEWFIDPITKEILEQLDYPTNFTDLVLYAVKLLSDNANTTETNMNFNRIRSNEIAISYLYSGIADAYIKYKNTASANNPTKIFVQQNYVMKSLATERIVEDYSKLNPIVTVEKLRVCSSKGPNGINLDDAYTLAKRAYDPSMVGIVGLSSSPDSSVGKIRKLTLEPKIKNARGFVDVNSNDLDSLTDANLFTAAEMVTPLGAARDDASRTAMASKQSSHIIASDKASPVLISNGTEQILHYHLNNEFTVVAEDDGEFVEFDEKNKLAIVKYKNGSHMAIDIGKTMDKNGAGGFFLSNEMICNHKVGDKFKKNDILAYDSKYFRDTLDGNKFCIGSLQNIAIMNEFATFEDSTPITHKMSKEMSTSIVMPRAVTIGHNATVDKMVKIGDEILVGDDLITFEESFEEESLNKLLATIGEELREEVKSLGKTPIRSDFSGVVEDIKIYSGSDLEELSPSLQKIVGDYWKGIRAKKSALNKYDKSSDIYKCGMLLTEPDHKYESLDGKIKGEKVDDGVLIIFYVKVHEPMNIGDKVANFTALKATVGYVIPEGYEPYGLTQPDKEISAMIAPAAVMARMTPSILLTMFGNKTLIKLKDELRKIYEEK